MSGKVVIDASLAAMWAVPERYSEQALTLAERWSQAGSRLLAPCLLLAEVTNALYKRMVRREMDLHAALGALRVILEFPIEIREEPGLQERAMALALELRQPTTYDCHYLALAEHHQCELWTGDQRFQRAAKDTFPFVMWIGNP